MTIKSLSYRDLDLQSKQIEACVQRLQRALQEDTLRPQLQIAALLTAACMVMREGFPYRSSIWATIYRSDDQRIGRSMADELIKEGPVTVETCLGRLSLLIAKEASLAEAIEVNPVEINGKRLLKEG